jgi:O-antigen/teichoic acid export membrane protein
LAGTNIDLKRGQRGTTEVVPVGLKERALRGGSAKIGAQAVNITLRLGSLMVLARLLDPKDFGLVAMVTAITGVFGLFKDAGLSMATVQRVTISNEQMSTLFWINMLVGVILAFLLIAIAPGIADFYHEPRLYWVTVALAADFLFTGATAQHSALLQRQMRFGTMAVIDIITLLAGITVAIAMAAAGLGYWALVGQAVTMPGVGAICIWIAVRWIPGKPRRKVGILSMVRFGSTVTLNGLVVYIAYNLDKVLLGRYWGANALGLYGRAYQLINLPTDSLNSSVGGVAISALSRIQDDPNRLKRYFLKGYSLVLALTLPCTLACAVFADDMILVFLGPKWQDVVPIFRLLAPTIVVFGLINPFAWLLFSIGLVGRSLKIVFVILPLVIAAYLIGLPHGPNGVALAYSAAMALWVIPHIAWCIHGTEISSRDILQTVSRPFVSGIVAAALALGVRFSVGQLLPPFLRLALGGSIMLASYLWMLLYVMGQKEFYLDLLRELRSRSPVVMKAAGP